MALLVSRGEKKILKRGFYGYAGIREVDAEGLSFSYVQVRQGRIRAMLRSVKWLMNRRQDVHFGMGGIGL